MSDRQILLNRWSELLDGISDEHMAYQTAKLFENQAKEFLNEAAKLNEEAITPGTTTVGKIGTYQKWAFPMIRRMYPELIFNKIGGTQTMDGPVSQVFYLGNSRSGNRGGTYTTQTMYSQYRITPLGATASAIGSASGATGGWAPSSISGLTRSQAANGFDLSNVLDSTHGAPSTTMGGQIASWPNNTILGWSVSAAERLRLSGIPEVTMHIQKQVVQARERKMRALWTLEAAQDLKAYHNLDMEAELTQILTKEMSLEIDRELIEDVRMVAYGFTSLTGNPIAGWALKSLINGNADNFPEIGGIGQGDTAENFAPGAYNYDFAPDGLTTLTGEASNGAGTGGSNVFVVDLSWFASQTNAFAPQHLGHIYSNLLAVINHASQDIYRTTLRGPGNVIITSPMIATMLESAAKLQGGIEREDGPTNNNGSQISYAGKFMGRYDLIIDPMFPLDEIIVAYKGSGPMDAGIFHCPYIPIMPLDKVTDPETFQPRRGILTRYGKVAVQPSARFFRVVRLIGAGVAAATPEIYRLTGIQGTTSLGY